MRSDVVKRVFNMHHIGHCLMHLVFTKEEMQKPLIGVVSSYNEIVPGHIHLDKIVDAVKMGVEWQGSTTYVSAIAVVMELLWT